MRSSIAPTPSNIAKLPSARSIRLAGVVILITYDGQEAFDATSLRTPPSPSTLVFNLLLGIVILFPQSTGSSLGFPAAHHHGAGSECPRPSHSYTHSYE
jgi:hypothetical protein